MTLPVPSQRTWSVYDLVTAAEMNSNVRDAVDFLAAPPTLDCYQSAAQTVPNSAATAVTFDTNVVDTYAGHSTVTNPSRYVGKVAGYYLVLGKVYFGANATGDRQVSIYLNGANIVRSQTQVMTVTTATHASGLLAAALVYLNGSTDYVETYAYQNSGAGLALVANGSGMQAVWVHS